MVPASPPPPHEVQTVSDLTEQVKDLLSGTFSAVWVRGEVTQWRPATSGHVYFTLKDAGAVLPCVMWRSAAVALRFRPAEGMEVLAGGALDVYPPHGRYQLSVRTLQPMGAGALQQAFERMKKRLEDEGLFQPGTKVPLPFLPRRIALVTSPTGAAVRDLVTVIQRRFPAVTLVLVPVRVQGAGSAEEIARGIAFADRAARADVIIAGRGGGSLEDLWAFNEEVVARAIHACRTPIVSAVGHETDVTIADLVADVRAATPSQAGELVVPVRAELLAAVEGQQRRLSARMRTRLDRAWQGLEAWADRPALRSPAGVVQPRRERLRTLLQRLGQASPAAALRRRRDGTDALALRLQQAASRRLLARRARLERAEAALRALSPLGVMARGWSLTSTPDGRLVRAAGDAPVGTPLRTRLADGATLHSTVQRVEPPGGARPAGGA
ncbi:MAG: exodeoxyribonuclease VII large subunit [Planctomycetia bacterium]